MSSLAGNRFTRRDAREIQLLGKCILLTNPGTTVDGRAMVKDLAGRSALAFLQAELRLGLTMSRIALQSRHSGKKERNRINARKAYDAILHYLPSSNLSAQEVQEIKTGLSELRSELLNLGEKL